MSAESIISRIETIQNAIGQDYISALVEEGRTVASSAFGHMAYVYDLPSGNGFGVAGTPAMIAEFGAGIDTDSSHEFAQDMDFPVRRGSYSDARHGEYSRTGYDHWTFGGRQYTTVKPRRGMYLGMKIMRNKYEDIFKGML